MTISRKQYVAFKGDEDAKKTMHQAYYAQFANEKIVGVIAGKFSPQELVDAYREDQHLNGIELSVWDDVARYVYPWIDQDLVKATGQFWSLNTGTCVCKAAAKVLISRALGENIN